MIHVRYSTAPTSAETATTADLRDGYLVQELFVDGEVRATYTHEDRLLPLTSLLVLALAAPAAAHATLIATDPAEGAVLETAPEQVTFTFNESVIGAPAGITVFDATGEEVGSSA